MPRERLTSDAAAGAGLTTFQAVVVLAAIVSIGVAVRLLGSHWLIGAGLQPDFSFQPNDNRFVEAAKAFRDYPTLYGYVLGMVSQLFVVLEVAKVIGVDVNALLALRGISVFHAALTIVLTCVLSMNWVRDRAQAVMAALFLALCPLHIVNSNFGTADVAAVCLFYLTVLAGTKYLQTSSQAWFTAMTAFCGFALAVKFFIPLLAVLAVVVATERSDRRWGMALTAAFVLAGAFAVASLFNYTPWDFAALLRMLIYDNVSVVDGKGPVENVVAYSWRLLSSLGLPLGLLAIAGIARAAWRAIGAVRARPRPVGFGRMVAALRTPAALLALPLVIHGIMIVSAGVSSARHLLVYMPVLCVLAAATLLRQLRAVNAGPLLRWVVPGALAAYLLWNAVGLQALYRNDIRWDLAQWAEARASEGHRVHAASFYTPVRGTSYDRERDLANIADGDFVVTCDLEFERYLGHEDAERIFHPKGGQARADFYRTVFLGDSKFKVAAVFRQRLYTPEQRLIAAGWLPMLQTFTPSLCLALGARTTLPPASQEAARREATRDTPNI